MKRTFVLDTNVLLHDPSAILRFKDNDVVLPITVIEELDRFKKQPEMTGRNARQVSRTLDIFRQQGHLIEGVSINNGGVLKVALCSRETLSSLPVELEHGNGDNAILAVALEMKRVCQCDVVLVSKDTNLRIKADAVGLDAEDYETDKVDIDELYTGTKELIVSSNEINQFFKDGVLIIDDDFFPNEAITLVDEFNPSHTALGIVNYGRIVPLEKIPVGSVSRIQPRNREQQFALNLLLNDSISLVTLVGKAGTGKTLLAIAAGLQKIADERIYTRL